MSIDWTDVIKYGLAMALTGGLTGGGAMWERSSLIGRHQESLGRIVQMIQYKDCVGKND